MKRLRAIRIAFALVAMLSAVMLLTLHSGLGDKFGWIRSLQVIPSALGVTLGATLFWFVVTLLFGRVYCSTVCPVGTVCDLPLWLRRAMPRYRKPFRYSPRKRYRFDILVVYAVTLLFGNLVFAFVVEPWNIMRNLASLISPGAVMPSWLSLGVPAVVGMITGAVSLAVLWIWGWRWGRGFCTRICPIGTAMGSMQRITLYNLAIDPDKCSGCLKCEDICPSHCIQVTSRTVDNSRCVRCLDCLDACPHEAISFTAGGRMRPGTPLFQKDIKACSP